MPDCRHMASLLEKYVDEALSQDETVFVKGHLKGCRRCQKELDELLAIRKHLRQAVAAGVADVPLAEIWEGMAERLEAPTVMERIWWWGKALFFPVRPLKALAWGAALVVLFLVTIPLVTAPPTPRVVVESVESEHPVMIFQGEDEITIVWLFEKEEGKEGMR
jgi:anti-sigma factor RsiW